MGGGRTAKQEAAGQGRLKQEAQRKRRFAAIALGVVAVVVVTVMVSGANDKKAADKLETQLTAGDCKLDSQHDGGRDHVASPTFSVDPPAGGDHLAQAAAAGAYDSGPVPADGNLVHALEHGFIVLWYKPGISADDLDGLLTIADEHSDATLVVPRPSLDVPIAATAWHKRLLCPSFERDTLVEFVEGYRDQGPEKGFM